MNADNKPERDQAMDPEVEKALANGRNANDNFPTDEKDDYQENDPEALRERQEIKGGAGQHGKIRNRNDDFKDEEE